MNTFSAIVAQIEASPKLQPTPTPEPKPSRKKPDASVFRRGRQIDQMRNQGMRMIDIAKHLGLTKGYVNGVYSTYRKFRAHPIGD